MPKHWCWSQGYMFAEGHLIGDVKVTFNQALDIDICNFDNFNKIRMEITKHAFPTHAFYLNLGL